VVTRRCAKTDGRNWYCVRHGSLALVVQCSPTDPSMLACRESTPLRFDIVTKITRSEAGFTEGPKVHDDGLCESTGRISGTTRLNLISLDGTVTRLADLGTTVFGEGLTILKDEIFQLTWREHNGCPKPGEVSGASAGLPRAGPREHGRTARRAGPLAVLSGRPT
jgi:hypothetical protein